MAYGHELILGIQGKADVERVATELGMRINWGDGSRRATGDWSEDSRDRLKEIDAKLRAAHIAAIEEIGLAVLDPADITVGGKPIGKRESEGYVFAKSPAGTAHQLQPFCLTFYYDPDEMGDTPETATVGVSLVTRYFPCFLDWNKESGGSGDDVVLTPDVLAKIEIARKHIAKVLPFVVDAPAVIKEIHY